jgi:glycosyltransferase involved in cell wall biosynthesis
MNARGRRFEHAFVVPDTSGSITGGTLYNRELVDALAERGFAIEVCDLDAALAAPDRPKRARSAGVGRFLWLDSLYLDALPELRRAYQSDRIGLLLHYLPSLVARGRELAPADLGAAEARALEQADAIVATSAFMREIVEKLGARARGVSVIEPGRLASGVAEPAPVNDGLNAIVVANLMPGKGVEPFLRALADELLASDRFRLTIVGSDTLDPRYAAACRDVAMREARLSAVELAGSLDPRSTLECMADKNLVVSASVMEAYGMAVAEARTLGVPILARSAGNLDGMVEPRAGGELVADHRELSRAFVRLCRNRLERARRIDCARMHAWPARHWTQAAAEFIALTDRLEAGAAVSR